MQTKCSESLQRQRARVWIKLTYLKQQSSITDRSKAVLLLWFLNASCHCGRLFTVSSNMVT